MKLQVVPVSLAIANAFVSEKHRHHPKVQGHKFSLGCTLDGTLVGVVVVGRPVARLRDDGFTAEVTRLCTDGTYNVCSMLYSAAAKVAFAMGYCRIGTYTLPEEDGASLRAAGWNCRGEAGGGNWNVKSRPRKDTPDRLQKTKWLWERVCPPNVRTLKHDPLI